MSSCHSLPIPKQSPDFISATLYIHSQSQLITNRPNQSDTENKQALKEKKKKGQQINNPNTITTRADLIDP